MVAFDSWRAGDVQFTLVAIEKDMMLRRHAPPRWPAGGRGCRRVLVEHECEAVAYNITRILEDEGCYVAIGSELEHRARGRRRLVSDGTCAAVHAHLSGFGVGWP